MKINNKKLCLTCNAEFTTANWDKDKKYCSNKCYGEDFKLTKKVCNSCGVEKERSQYSQNLNKKGYVALGRFCKVCIARRVFIKTPDSYINYILRVAKRRAKKKNLDFDLLVSDMQYLYEKQKGLCALTKMKMGYTPGLERNNINYNISIDRIDSSKGYTKDNIQLVCASLNNMKMDLKNKHFIQLCKLVAGVPLSYNKIITDKCEYNSHIGSNT